MIMGMAARCSLMLLCALLVATPAAAVEVDGCPSHKPNCCNPLSSEFDISLYLQYCVNIDPLPLPS